MSTHFRTVPLKVGVFTNFEKSLFTFGRNFGVKIEAPCIMWVLEGGGHTIVVDAGPSCRGAARPYHAVLVQPPEQSPEQAMRLAGFDPDRVELVILTHLHWDHVGEAEIFRNATFLVQADELREAVVPLRVQRHPFEVGIRGVIPRWMAVFDRIEAVEGECEPLAGLRLVPLPGHTVGMQGVYVETAGGPHLIAGDAIPLFENLQGDATSPYVPSGIHSDLRLYEQTLTRLREMRARILPGHDMAVFDGPYRP